MQDLHLECGICRGSYAPNRARTPSSEGGHERALPCREEALRPTKLIILLLAFSAFLAELTDPSGKTGRLNYINGPVSSQPAFVTDWVNANFNRPLTSSDPIWGGDGGPASVRGGSTELRSRSNAAYQFLNVDDRTMQIRRLLGYDYSPPPKSRVAAPADSAESAMPAASMIRAGSSAVTRSPIPLPSRLAQAAGMDWKK